MRTFFITGTSGSGKSTLTKLLKDKLPKNQFAVHDFDENGVPPNADEIWRQTMTKYWLAQAIKNAQHDQITVICGVTVPTEVIGAAKNLEVQLYFGFMKISDDMIKERLRERGWSEQLIQDNINWAHCLEHNVTEQKNHMVLDCSNGTPEQIADKFVVWVLTEKEHIQSHEQMIQAVILSHFGQNSKFIRRIVIGICNEVYEVGLENKEVIVRLSPYNKFLMGSHDHIPKFKLLGIKVPDILIEDYSKADIPFSYQIQSKIEGRDLGNVIETLTDEQLKALAREIATIFKKVKTIPTDGQFGIIWGGGDNELSHTWTERMRLWIDESSKCGRKTGVMDDSMLALAEKLYIKCKTYFDSVKSVTYCGDISSKNVMIYNGIFNGLVDLDGLTQGDPLEAVGRIKISWYGTHYGEVYTNAVMDEMGLNKDQRKLVTVYALLNGISWACQNGIQFNQNTKSIVDRKKAEKDKAVIKAIVAELQL